MQPMQRALAGQRLPVPACHTNSISRVRVRGGAVKSQLATLQRTRGPAEDSCDVVLSSGFLAFAGHAGFLKAVEEAGVPVAGVMGTSAGALTGSLYCAGYTPEQIAHYLSEQPPAALLRPGQPWRGGALSLEGVIERLRQLLPPTFEDLPREFAVGVVTADGQHLLIDSGPLPEAVAASAAIPVIFEAVDVPGGHSRYGPFKDGGIVDRVGLRAWRDRRRAQLMEMHGTTAVQPPTCLVHVIERSSAFSGADDVSSMGEHNIVVVKSPRAQANFFDLGSFSENMAAAVARARPKLEPIAARSSALGATHRLNSIGSGSTALSSSSSSHASSNGNGNGNGRSGSPPHGQANGAAVNGTAVHLNGNGHVNGYANGYANGHANGHVNGHANGHASKPAVEVTVGEGAVARASS